MYRLRDLLEIGDDPLAGAVMASQTATAHDQSLVLHLTNHHRHRGGAEIDPDQRAGLVHGPPPTTIRPGRRKSAQVCETEPAASAAHQAASDVVP